MVEVFRTDVGDEQAAQRIIRALMGKFPHACITFDLGDCDKILRVSSPGTPVEIEAVIEAVKGMGYSAEALE